MIISDRGGETSVVPLLRVAPFLLLLTACPALDVSQPIALIPGEDWTETNRRALSDAADCWNMEFGTQLVVGDSTVAQQVTVEFSDFICTYAPARTDPQLPVRVFFCKGWFTGQSYLLFHVLAHELGHVLNIRPHASDPASVMASGDSFLALNKWLERFSDEDRRLLAEANPDLTPQRRCSSVEFSVSGDRHGCLCIQPEVAPPPTSADLRDVWRSEQGDVWAVGQGGTIVHLEHAGWKLEPSGTTEDLNGLTGDQESGELWAVGARGTVLHRDKTAWKPEVSGTTQDLLGVASGSYGGSYDWQPVVWAVGGSGTILRRAAGAWLAMASPTSRGLYSVRSTFGDNAWAAGVGGTLLHYDGDIGPDWAVVQSRTDRDLFGLGDANRGVAWAVGQTGLLAVACDHALQCFWSGTTVPIPDTTLRGVYSGHSFKVWVVGDGGTLLRFDKWDSLTPDHRQYPSGTTARLDAVWSDGTDGVWAVGQGGTIVRLPIQLGQP